MSIIEALFFKKVNVFKHLAINETLGERLKQLRSDHGFTQKQVSSMLGVDRATYGNYEKDKRIPPFDVIEKFAKLLNVSLDLFTSKEHLKQEITKDTSVDSKIYDKVSNSYNVDELKSIALELISENAMLNADNKALRKKLVQLMLEMK